MTRLRFPALLALLLTLLIGSSAWAQSAPAEPAAPAAEAHPAENPSVGPGELELLLHPLFAKQLEYLTTTWLEFVQQADEAVTTKKLEALRAPNADIRTARLEEVAGVRDARTAVIDRARLVVGAWRAKGGDVTIAEAYLSSVEGLVLDTTDGNTVLTSVKSWVRSPEGGVRWGRNILFFLLTLLAFRILAGIVGRILRRVLDSPKIQFSEMLEAFFVNTARNMVMALGVVVALSMLEIEVGPFLAAFGVVGFIIGFALQDTLGNFAAGLMILLYRPYDLGDFVTAGGETGSVSSMSLVSTTLTTPDNKVLVVPNGKIWGGTITNVTGNETRRCDLVFGIGYEDDIDKAEAILQELVAAHENALDDPEPVVRLHELADSSVNFVVRVWVKTSDYWGVYWDLTRQVKQRFDQDGISIPFPQRDVHVHHINAPDSSE